MSTLAARKIYVVWKPMDAYMPPAIVEKITTEPCFARLKPNRYTVAESRTSKTPEIYFMTDTSMRGISKAAIRRKKESIIGVVK